MKTDPKTKLRSLARHATAAVSILLTMGILSARAADGGASPDDGAEVLTRGPIHEAFAGTITFKPVEGMMVPQAAPALIEELPPDQRPEGENISWIPGYWAWDDEGTTFIWVSGIWRNLPPGRQWMPGYWSDAGSEFQWISGYWADAALEEVEYLSEPPESREVGPNIEAPSRDHSWIPGSWIWRESRYLWRPGYWDVNQPDWVWVPSYYVRTPRGHVYVDGYWDYAVARRGMIFAPVRFSGNYYSRPDYIYRPSTVIGLAALVDHLFLRPRQRHYYFGDYYAPEYQRSGYYASYTYSSGGHGYDPIYAHNRWSHRDDDRWERRNEENYRFYRDNQDERPPHTLAAFEQFNARARKDRRVDAGYVMPLTQLAVSKENRLKLKSVNEDERQRLAKHGREIRDFGEQRRKIGMQPEGAPERVKPGKGESGKPEPVRVKIPRSPAAAKVTEQAAKEDTPPKRREVTTQDDKPGDKQGKPGDKPQPIPGTQPGDELGRKPKDPSKPETKDIPKADPKMDPKRQPRPEPNADPKRQPRPEPKADPKREPRPEPKAEPKREPRPEPKAEPKREPRPEPKLEPKREPRPEPKLEPKREPRPEPKLEPKREPRPTPKAEPKREPRPEPKLEPKREPRPEPKAAPKREPRPEPRAEPKREPKAEPEGKDKKKKKDQPVAP